MRSPLQYSWWDKEPISLCCSQACMGKYLFVIFTSDLLPLSDPFHKLSFPPSHQTTQGYLHIVVSCGNRRTIYKKTTQELSCIFIQITHCCSVLLHLSQANKKEEVIPKLTLDPRVLIHNKLLWNILCKSSQHIELSMAWMQKVCFRIILSKVKGNKLFQSGLKLNGKLK